MSMPTSTDPDLDALTLVADELVSAYRSIQDRHWTRATPCPDWSLADLVDHVTGGNRFTVRILGGEDATSALARTRDSFAAGHAGCDGSISAIEELVAAFREPAALHRPVDHVAGELSGRQVLRLRLQDLIVHAWDISETIDPPASIPAQLVRWGLDELDDSESLVADHFGLTPSTLDAPTSPDQARYLAVFGR